eukprot:m51a1_g7553 hypothetical protein (165) ;mRNA; f:95498-96067
MVLVDELVSTLEGLKQLGGLQRRVKRIRALLLRAGGVTSPRPEHLKQLEHELTVSALRLAAKANMLSDIFDTARRLQCAQHMAEAHQLAHRLVLLGEAMQKALDETRLWTASRKTAKRAITLVREASNMPEVDEFLATLCARLASLERGRSTENHRPRASTMPW